MKRTPARRSSLFLLECIIAILFFIIAATVCVQLFAKSYTLSRDSENLTMAVQLTTSYVEEFRGGKDFPEKLQIYYDESWIICEESESAHTLTITITSEWNLMKGSFVMDDIYEITSTKYVGGSTE